jgi:uncharacterized membrane-anchored protein
MTTNETANDANTAIDVQKTIELPPLATTAPYAPMRKKFIGAIILQLGVLAAMFSMPAYTLATGESVFLKTRIYDPWDMFRGQYITLTYDGASNVPSEPGLHPGQTVYVVLRKNSDYSVAEKAYSQMPTIDHKKYAVVRATVKHVIETPSSIDVVYGIERYYIPEHSGERFSKAEGPLTAELAVDNFGNCVLKKVVPSSR